MKSKRESPTIFESPDLVAFVILYQNVKPKPFLRMADRRVCFEFDADVTPSIQAFYDNVSVPIADYCKNLKMIRSMIFNMKGGTK